MPAGWHVYFFESRMKRWLDKRIPLAKTVRLGQRNLFIFPSRLGLVYFVLVTLLWIGATNYQSSPAYGLCFLLLSVLWLAVLYTFANVSGLQIRFVDAISVFVGDTAHFQFEISSTSAHQKLDFFWPNETIITLSLSKNSPVFLHLPATTHTRGYFYPARFCLQSTYPLGIVRCWTWLNLESKTLVYPKPIETDYQLCSRGNDTDNGLAVTGNDDYFSLKLHHEGDLLSRVAWKQYAAGRGLFVREYVDYQGSKLWLDFSALDDADVELRLSKLCYCVLQSHKEDRPYGLRLPSGVIAPNTGEPHLHNCLRALALYPL